MNDILSAYFLNGVYENFHRTHMDMIVRHIRAGETTIDGIMSWEDHTDDIFYIMAVGDLSFTETIKWMIAYG